MSVAFRFSKAITENKRRQESFSVFVASTIHPDTVEAAEWQSLKYKIDILTFNINEFIEKITVNNKICQLLIS